MAESPEGEGAEGSQDGSPGSAIDIKQWTRIVLILAATLYMLQGGDPTTILV